MNAAPSSPVRPHHNADENQDAIMSSPPPPSPRKKSSSAAHHIVVAGGASDTTKKQLFQAKRRRASSGGATASPKRRKPAFDLLDATNNDVHAKRIASREKAIRKGKNTAGYDAYLAKVPKEARRPRSMETPSTPNPAWDIPAKRWQGIVKAWRRALHKYDPPDMMRNEEPSFLDDSIELSPEHEVSTMGDTTPHSAASHPSDEASPMSTGRVLNFGDDDDSDDDLL